MARRTAARANLAEKSCDVRVMAQAVGPEQVGRGTVDRQRHVVADLDLAVGVVLGGDRLSIAKPGIDERAFAEPLDQLNPGHRRRSVATADPDVFGPEPKPQIA